MVAGVKVELGMAEAEIGFWLLREGDKRIFRDFSFLTAQILPHTGEVDIKILNALFVGGEQCRVRDHENLEPDRIVLLLLIQSSRA